MTKEVEKPIKDIRNPIKEVPKEQTIIQEVELTPEDKADKQLQDIFFDDDEEVMEIDFV